MIPSVMPANFDVFNSAGTEKFLISFENQNNTNSNNNNNSAMKATEHSHIAPSLNEHY